MTKETESPKSPFALAIEARFAERVTHEFDVDGYFGIGGKPIPKLGIRTLMAGEQLTAVDQAYRIVKARTVEPEARTSPEVFDDVKICCIVFEAARALGDVSKFSYPAFPGPEWMLKHMTSEQIGALANLANTVKVRESPTAVEFGEDAVEAFAVTLSANTETPAGRAQNDVILAGLPREHLDGLVVAIADKLMTARALLAAYVKEQRVKDQIAEQAADANAPEPDPT